MYEYNFYDHWKIEIRIEKTLPVDSKKSYPMCIEGRRSGPPEDCGGPWAFMTLKDEHSLWYIEDRLLEDEPKYEKLPKFAKAAREFREYIYNNKELIPNYADRYHYGEAISTAFVESTVNEVVSRRMVKKQQMRWTHRGAHHMLQLRTKTLNNELRETFYRWYPGMTKIEGEFHPMPDPVPQDLMN